MGVEVLRNGRRYVETGSTFGYFCGSGRRRLRQALRPDPGEPDRQALGLVLEGGRVCKDENSVASIDYPKAKAEALTSQYVTTLGTAGWKTETPSEGTILATKDSDTLFIVTGKKSKDRRVPFAIIRYCEESECRDRLTELAKAMSKYGSKE